MEQKALPDIGTRLSQEPSAKKKVLDAAHAFCKTVRQVLLEEFHDDKAWVSVGIFPDVPEGYGIAVVVPEDEIGKYQAVLDAHFVNATIPVQAMHDDDDVVI